MKESPRKSLNYLLKYIGKPCEFDEPRDYAIYLAALQRVRRIHTYGVFYNWSPPDEKEPCVCSQCGAGLEFDKAFRFDFGEFRTSFLKFFYGISPCVPNRVVGRNVTLG